MEILPLILILLSYLLKKDNSEGKIKEIFLECLLIISPIGGEIEEYYSQRVDGGQMQQMQIQQIEEKK